VAARNARCLVAAAPAAAAQPAKGPADTAQEPAAHSAAAAAPAQPAESPADVARDSAAHLVASVPEAQTAEGPSGSAREPAAAAGWIPSPGTAADLAVAASPESAVKLFWATEAQRMVRALASGGSPCPTLASVTS